MRRAFRIEPLITPAGLYLGSAGAFEVEMERIHRVVERTVYCLYCKHTGNRLPDTHEATCYSDESLKQFPREQLAHFMEKIARPLSAYRLHKIGGDAFAYRHFIFEEDPRASMWSLTFYESFSYIVLTAKCRAEKRERGVALPK